MVVFDIDAMWVDPYELLEAERFLPNSLILLTTLVLLWHGCEAKGSEPVEKAVWPIFLLL